MTQRGYKYDGTVLWPRVKNKLTVKLLQASSALQAALLLRPQAVDVSGKQMKH